MHIQENRIQAYLDQQINAHERARLESHLDQCQRCQKRIATVRARKQRLEHALTSLDASSSYAPLSYATALRSFREKLALDNQEQPNMWKKLTAKIPRPLWLSLAVALILAIMLSFAPVRAIANSFLGLLRVEQIRVVQVDYAEISSQLGSSSQIESLLSDNVQFQQNGDIQEVTDAQQAGQLAGIKVRLPASADGQPHLAVKPSSKVVFNVDRDLVLGVLKDLNQDNIQFPKSLDGATVTIEIPAAVIASYGDCAAADETQDTMTGDPDSGYRPSVTDCTALLQMYSPTINAPPELDIAQIGQAYLQILGMQPEAAQQFAQNLDWTTTFVVPIPRSGTNYKEVMVDNVNGTLITDYSGQYILLWAKNGLLYVLSGFGEIDAALGLANSIQ